MGLGLGNLMWWGGADTTVDPEETVEFEVSLSQSICAVLAMTQTIPVDVSLRQGIDKGADR